MGQDISTGFEDFLEDYVALEGDLTETFDEFLEFWEQ